MDGSLLLHLERQDLSTQPVVVVLAWGDKLLAWLLGPVELFVIIETYLTFWITMIKLISSTKSKLRINGHFTISTHFFKRGRWSIQLAHENWYFNFIGITPYYRRLVRHNFFKITSQLEFIIGPNGGLFLTILVE